MAIPLILPLQAQDELSDPHDTLFIEDHSDGLIGRIYSSTKYNALRIAGSSASGDLVYRPTNQFNLGIGASYRRFTLNLGFAIPFINSARRERLGRTRYLDAQGNLFGPKLATNLFLQVFKGYHLSSHDLQDLSWPEQETDRPYREDIVQSNFGITMLRVTNFERYSYRAALNQDAWQKRSQGSWLWGGYGTYYRLRADSSLVPDPELQNYSIAAAMRKGDLIDLGPMGGYAYTLVFGDRTFLMGSVAFGAGLSMQNITSEGEHDREHKISTIGPGWHLQLRSGIGYRFGREQLSITFNHERVHYLLPEQDVFAWGVGNIRLSFIHRFERKVPVFDRFLRKVAPHTPEVLQEVVPAIKEAAEEEDP